MESSNDEAVRHQALVDRLKASGCIRTPLVEAAFRAVPRHLFLPGAPLDLVYVCGNKFIATHVGAP